MHTTPGSCKQTNTGVTIRHLIQGSMPQPQRDHLPVISLQLVIPPQIWLQLLTPRNQSSQQTLDMIIGHPPFSHHMCSYKLTHQQQSVENINDYSRLMRLPFASSARLNDSSYTPLDDNEQTQSTIISTSVSYVEPVRLRDHTCSPHHNCALRPHIHIIQGRIPSQYKP